MNAKESNKKVESYFKRLKGRKFRKHHYTCLLIIYILLMTEFVIISVLLMFKEQNIDILKMLFSFFKPSFIVIGSIFLFDMFFSRIVALGCKDSVVVEEEIEIVNKTKHITEVCEVSFKDIKNIHYTPQFPNRFYPFNKEGNSFLLITLKNRKKIIVRHAPITLFYYIKKYCPHAVEKKHNVFFDIIKDVVRIFLILTLLLSVIIFFER